MYVELINTMVILADDALEGVQLPLETAKKRGISEFENWFALKKVSEPILQSSRVRRVNQSQFSERHETIGNNIQSKVSE